MTSVLGHITSAVFPAEYKSWEYPPPERLFDAPVHIITSEVCPPVYCVQLARSSWF